MVDFDGVLFIVFEHFHRNAAFRDFAYPVEGTLYFAGGHRMTRLALFQRE